MATKIKDLTPKMRVQNLEDELRLPLAFQDQTAQILGGLTAGSRELRHGKIKIQGVAERILFGDAEEFGTGVGVYIGKDPSDGLYKFRAGDPAGVSVNWNGSALNITGFIEEGGAAADVNANLTTIDGAKITTGTIVADKLLVTELSAITANLGTITAGTITGIVITGSTIKTAASGVRVQMNASEGVLRFYDSGNDIVGELDENGTDFYLQAKDGRNLALGADGAAKVYINDTLDMNSNTITAVGAISMGGAIDMNGQDINELDEIGWNTRSTNSSKTWALYMYSSGGYSLRTRMDGGTWSVDQTAV